MLSFIFTNCVKKIVRFQLNLQIYKEENTPQIRPLKIQNISQIYKTI